MRGTIQCAKSKVARDTVFSLLERSFENNRLSPKITAPHVPIAKVFNLPRRPRANVGRFAHAEKSTSFKWAAQDSNL
jgi:hypothetical protein